MIQRIAQKAVFVVLCAKPDRFSSVIHPFLNLHFSISYHTRLKPNFLYQPTVYRKFSTCKKSAEKDKNEKVLDVNAVNVRTPALITALVLFVIWLESYEQKEDTMASPKVLKGRIVVYSIVGCPHCLAAKSTLQDLGKSQPFTDLERIL